MSGGWTHPHIVFLCYRSSVMKLVHQSNLISGMNWPLDCGNQNSYPDKLCVLDIWNIEVDWSSWSLIVICNWTNDWIGPAAFWRSHVQCLYSYTKESNHIIIPITSILKITLWYLQILAYHSTHYHHHILSSFNICNQNTMICTLSSPLYTIIICSSFIYSPALLTSTHTYTFLSLACDFAMQTKPYFGWISVNYLIRLYHRSLYFHMTSCFIPFYIYYYFDSIHWHCILILIDFIHFSKLPYDSSH